MSSSSTKEEEEKFLEKLKSLDFLGYVCQKDSILYPQHAERILQQYAHWPQPFDKGPNIEGMDLGRVKHYSYSELQQITNSFSESHKIRKVEFGRLFQGTIKRDSADQDVIVKTWDFYFPPITIMRTYTTRIHDELNFLRIPQIEAHPNAVKLIGYHCDKKLAVIYEGRRPMYILDEVLENDTFDWDDRLKVAIGVGKILEMFHDSKVVHGGIFPENIMLDENFCLKTFDFRYREHNLWCYYEAFGRKDMNPPEWSFQDDVFAYGFLILELISKKDARGVWDSWYNKFKDTHVYPAETVVDASFSIDEGIASRIRKCGFDCLKARSPILQPSLEEILKMLSDAASLPAKKKQKYDHGQ